MTSPNLQKVTNAQLLSQIKRGDELAFDTLYNKYWKRIFAYSFNILNDKGLAEDVIHDVFSTIWIKRESLEVTSFENYLFVAVKNKSISVFRKVQFTELDDSIIANLSLEPEADNIIKNNDLEFTIEQALKNLPKKCRDIFYMSRYDNYSNAEIASHFQISQRTVENQLYLALKHLRGTIGEIISVLIIFHLF